MARTLILDAEAVHALARAKERGALAERARAILQVAREEGRLDGSSPGSLIARLLGDEHEVKLVGTATPAPPSPTESSDQRASRDAWDAQQTLLSKLRTIAEDAKTYEQDTGAQVLYVGFPLLQLPPDARQTGRFGATKRILAPVAFIPVKLAIKMTRPQNVTLSCAGEGADLGLRYVFPTQLGLFGEGMPTAFSVAPLAGKLRVEEDDHVVWAGSRATGASVVRGRVIAPLYPSVPLAAAEDPSLHEYLALADTLRIGRARERALAKEEISRRLAS